MSKTDGSLLPRCPNMTKTIRLIGYKSIKWGYLRGFVGLMTGIDKISLRAMRGAQDDTII